MKHGGENGDGGVSWLALCGPWSALEPSSSILLDCQESLFGTEQCLKGVDVYGSLDMYEIIRLRNIKRSKGCIKQT